MAAGPHDARPEGHLRDDAPLSGSAFATPAPPASGRPLRLLVCAFGPFPGVPVNPSATVARDLVRLSRPALADAELHLVILPTRWDALGHLDALLAKLRPDGVLLFGVAARRRRVCVEMLAVNAARPVPDAAHRHPACRRLDAAGPSVLRSTAGATARVAALTRLGIAAAASRDAGRYLCNASYFHALAATSGPAGSAPPVLFVHLPGRSGRPAGVSRQALARGVSELLVALAAEARRAHRRRAQAR